LCNKKRLNKQVSLLFNFLHLNSSFYILLLSSLVVKFSWGNFDVKVNILGQGKVDGVGTFSNNSQVTLTAKPQTGYQFKGWSGDLAGEDSSITFTISSPITANAHFEPLSHKIVYINGRPALAGAFLAKLNETGRRVLRRRVNRVGDTLVYRRNKVLDDLVSIEWDTELKFQDNLSGQDLNNQQIQKLAEKRSALKSQGVESQLKEMLNSGNYEYVEPDWIITLDSTPSDSSYANGELWGLRNNQRNSDSSAVDANLENAWDISTGSNEITVAVIDSGIRYTHNDLKANMWKNSGEIEGNGIDDDQNGYVDDIYGINAISNAAVPGDPNDDNGHGTHCAGTIGAQANGGGDVVGVAWNVKLMALKFLSASGSGSTNDAIKCIDYAIANGANVINASYGGESYSTIHIEAIRRAHNAGIVFVAAAGNGGDDGIGDDNDIISYYPTSYEVDNVISVAAITRTGGKAGFSNYGLKSVDLGAPGVSIYSTDHLSDTDYSYKDGTSMAAPHVSGAAALILSREPHLTPSQVRERLIDTASPLASLSGKTVSGGMLDVHAALSLESKTVLGLDVTYSPNTPEKNGRMQISARLTSPQPVIGASVQATLGQNFTLLDNGVGADNQANDGIYSADVFAPNLLAFNLLISASASGFETVSKSLSVKTILRPSNDSFANALSLSSFNEITIGDNTHATLEEGEDHPINGITGTVWYKWLPSRSGDATLSTFGSSFDTTLAVYQGTELSNLQPIAHNDDISTLQSHSEVEFSAKQDEVYWLQIGGAHGKTGDFFIQHPQPIEPPPPTPVIHPPVIMSRPKDLTNTEGEPMSIGVEVVGTAPLSYQWVLNGGKIFGADQSSFSLPHVSLEDSGQYSVIVSNPGGSASADIANLKVRKSKDIPLNDDIENAALLEGENGNGLAVTRMATGQPNEPDHAGVSNPLHSVWWKWTAPKSGTVRVSTDGSSFDTTLAAYLLNETEDSRRSKEIGKRITSFTPATGSENLSIQLPDHGFSDGQEVKITGLLGHSSQNAKFLINRIDTGSFSLSGTAGLSNLSLSPASRITPLK
jgi:uncharacterized repeat protein (TIGR02543 family)